MRALVISRPKFPVPLEQFAGLVQAFADWRQRNRSSMESFEFFVGEGGGFGILNVPDEATLNQIMLEYPFAPFSEQTVHLCMNGDQGIEQLQRFIQSMSGRSS